MTAHLFYRNILHGQDIILPIPVLHTHRGYAKILLTVVMKGGIGLMFRISKSAADYIARHGGHITIFGYESIICTS